MIVAAVVGGLCALALWVIVRPFLTARSTPDVVPPSETASDALLRQLRDLEDDLARGTVSEADYVRLRGPLERQAAEALRVAAAPVPTPVPNHGVEDRPAPRTTSRRRKLGMLTAVVVVAAGLAVVAGTQLTGAVGQRPTAPATAGAPERTSLEPASAGPAAASDAALAAVRAAVHRVRRAPGAAASHVALAGAYAQAGKSQLATLEYLAARRLDPDSPEANTALALTAFKSGKNRLAASLVDRALRAHPRYAEALYVRGLVEAMGLHHPQAAARSFRAYLEAAPAGSDRTSAETLLALLKGGKK